MDNFRIAVLIPCFNEGDSIYQVVSSFKTHLPEADIYVYDNNSTDQTFDEANRARAIVRNEYRQGKGRVVCRMFSDIEADVYVLIDGDGTYDASVAKKMIMTLRRMTPKRRRTKATKSAKLLTWRLHQMLQ